MNTDRNLKNYKTFQVRFSRADFAKRFNYPVLVFDKDQDSDQEEDLGFETVCMWFELLRGQVINETIQNH